MFIDVTGTVCLQLTEDSVFTAEEENERRFVAFRRSLHSGGRCIQEVCCVQEVVPFRGESVMLWGVICGYGGEREKCFI